MKLYLDVDTYTHIHPHFSKFLATTILYITIIYLLNSFYFCFIWMYTRIHVYTPIFQNFHEALFGCKHVYTYTPPFSKFLAITILYITIILGYYYIVYYHNILTQNFLFLFYLDVYTYTRIHPHFSKFS